MDTNNQNTQPQVAQPQSQVQNFKTDPMQTTLSAGTKILSFAAMITSFIALFKRFMPKK